MKTTLTALFTIFSLVGCPAPKPPSPPVFPSQPASQEPPWPNVEYNRAAMVWVEYIVLDDASGWQTYYLMEGIVVAPRTIISSQFAYYFGQLIYNVQSITIRSISGDWFAIPALIVAETGDDAGDMVLLSTKNDLPNIRPAVFGGIPYDQKIEGYRFETDISISPGHNLKKIVPVFVEVSSTGQECTPLNQDDPNWGSSAGSITFDKNHNLVCVSWTSSAKVKRFLRANKIPFLEK